MHKSSVLNFISFSFKGIKEVILRKICTNPSQQKYAMMPCSGFGDMMILPSITCWLNSLTLNTIFCSKLVIKSVLIYVDCEMLG